MMRALLLISLMFCALPACANPLIADLSTYDIKMDSSFTGARMLLFGARNEGGDVVVVVRGPESDFTIRRKERMAGIWVNGDSVTFSQVPEYYAVITSRPLDQIRAQGLLHMLGIGPLELLHQATVHNKAKVDPAEFRRAFLSHQTGYGLYREIGSLQFMGETLFKTVIQFPDTIPAGDYTAEVYLLSGGELTSMQTVPIKVKKSGMDAAVYSFAHRYPSVYGVLAVAVALLAGWTASRVFEKI